MDKLDSMNECDWHLLSPKCRFKVRAVEAFKSVAVIVYEDSKKHKWKVPIYVVPAAGLGIALFFLTAAYHLKSKQEMSVKFRQSFWSALNDTIHYDLYKAVLRHSSPKKKYPYKVQMWAVCMNEWQNAKVIIAADYQSYKTRKQSRTPQ